MRIQELFESEEKLAAFAFGRLNPPTIGHEKLVGKIIEEAGDGDAYLFVSHSTDTKKNPLDFDTKEKYVTLAFKHTGIKVGHKEVRTPVQALQHLEKLRYTHVKFIVGSDRIDGFQFINDYNGKDYNFESIEIVSAGERDPDADGVEGMSASKMREAAKNGDFESFTAGLPRKLPKAARKQLYNAVRKGLNVE